MGKATTRVYELANELGTTAKELRALINAEKLGFTVQTHMGTLSETQVMAVRRLYLRKQRSSAAQTQRSSKGTEDAAKPAPKTGSAGVRIRRRRKPVPEAEASAVADNTPIGLSRTRVRKAAKPVEASKAVEAPKPVEAPKVEPIAEEPVVEPVAPVATDSAEVAKPAPVKQTPKKPKASKSKAREIQLGVTEEPEGTVEISVQEAAPSPKADVEASAPEGEHVETAEVEKEDEIIGGVKKIRRTRPVDMESKPTRQRKGSSAKAGRERVAQPADPNSSNIVGFIDKDVLISRLKKDGKTFDYGGNQPGGKRGKSSRNRREHDHVDDIGPRSGASRSNKDMRSFREYVPQGGATHRRGKTHRSSKRKSATPDRSAITQAAEHKRVVRIADSISVSDMAQQLGVKASEVIGYVFKNLGEQLTMNQTMGLETAELVAEAFSFTVQDVSFKEEDFIKDEADSPEDLELRPPVVTVMGHVDHGKTSLLDAIRNSSVLSTEAGGITQHIGASTIESDSGKVVFLDTPGHEAFTALRARGAQVTDLVILVVAADDGVMPQTVEAINHAKAADVPIIVAVNKKKGANPDRVKQALTEFSLIPEDWGGSTIFTEVSALTGQNIPELLELIELQSEVLELRANPNKEAKGIILESFKDPRKGTVATMIVQDGTLKKGDIVVSGATYGKVKSMTNDKGRRVKSAGPSMPVSITGLNGIPDAGEIFFVVDNEKTAKTFTSEMKERKRASELKSRKVDIWAQFKDSKVLNVIVKADVQGSIEALEQSLVNLSTDEVELKVVHTAVGAATESDVQLAIATGALIVCFNTRPEARALELAKREGINIESFSVIYDVIDMVKDALSGLLDPILSESVIGHAEIRETFSVPKVGTIAGAYVTDGKLIRNAKVRLLRSGKIIYESRIATLKRFKDDAKEVRSGFECGFSIENYNDIKVGDTVEVFEIVETKATL